MTKNCLQLVGHGFREPARGRGVGGRGHGVGGGMAWREAGRRPPAPGPRRHPALLDEPTTERAHE